MVLLGPVQDFAFEIGFLKKHRVHVVVGEEKALQDDFLRFLVAFVEENCADEGLKSIAACAFGVGVWVDGNEFVEVDFAGERAQLLAAHHAGTHFRKFALRFEWEFLEKVFSCNCIQNSVAQIFEAFVADGMSANGAVVGGGAVNERGIVKFGVFRADSKNCLQKILDLLIVEILFILLTEQCVNFQIS